MVIAKRILEAFLQHYGSEGNYLLVEGEILTLEETEKYFDGVSEGGKITMPLEETFWNSYFGMATDKFGVNWMFSFDLK